MSSFDAVSSKLKNVFGDAVVRKDLTLYGHIGRLPRFIAEYLIASICGDRINEECLRRVSEVVERYYREPQERDVVKHELVRSGRVKIIGEIKVWKDLESGLNRVELLNIPLDEDITISDEIIEENPRLLEMGLWGMVTLEYDPSSSIKLRVSDFRPFQIAKVDLNRFIEGRREFETEEWIDVLVSTIGYNPGQLPRRKKLLIITRLLPLVEENLNMIELGPRGTGKTYVFSNMSFYTRIFSGGKVSPATLIWHLGRDAPGEIPTRDCVVFDEVSKIDFMEAAEMMGKLKHFMESGEYERGKRRGSSGCSLAFLGNVEVEREKPVEEFTYVLPQEMRDPAFVDRLHGFIPGWEVPKVGKAKIYLSRYYGFAIDYFSEIMHQLRRKAEFIAYINDHVEVTGTDKFRDERAVKKIGSGLLKILCPHGEFDREELRLVMDIATEYRQNIADWLHYMAPGEYDLIKLSYEFRGV